MLLGAIKNLLSIPSKFRTWAKNIFINSAILAFENSSHRCVSHVMVDFNWELLLSIPQLCASTFHIAHSGLGIRFSFAYGLAYLVRDAVDEGAYAVECVQAGGVGQAISWFIVVDHNERAPAADVLPRWRVKCSYAFSPNPYKRVFTLVGFIGTSMDVVIDILCVSKLSRRRSGRCRDAKEEDASELDKEFA